MTDNLEFITKRKNDLELKLSSLKEKVNKFTNIDEACGCENCTNSQNLSDYLKNQDDIKNE